MHLPLRAPLSPAVVGIKCWRSASGLHSAVRALFGHVVTCKREQRATMWSGLQRSVGLALQWEGFLLHLAPTPHSAPSRFPPLCLRRARVNVGGCTVHGSGALLNVN